MPKRRIPYDTMKVWYAIPLKTSDAHGYIDHLKACFDKGESMPQSWYPKRNMNFINQESAVCQKGPPKYPQTS